MYNIALSDFLANLGVLSNKKQTATVWHGLGHVNHSCIYSVGDHKAGRVSGGWWLLGGHKQGCDGFG